MADEMHVEYEGLEEVAKAFQNQSEEMNQMLSAIKSSYQPLRGGDFQGAAADAFFNEMESLLFPANQRLIEALARASETTSTVSQNIQSAEQEAQGLFKAA